MTYEKAVNACGQGWVDATKQSGGGRYSPQNLPSVEFTYPDWAKASW